MPEIGEFRMLDCGFCKKQNSHVFTIREGKKSGCVISSDSSSSSLLEIIADLVFNKATTGKFFVPAHDPDLIYQLGWQCTICGNLIVVLETDDAA